MKLNFFILLILCNILILHTLSFSDENINIFDTAMQSEITLYPVAQAEDKKDSCLIFNSTNIENGNAVAEENFEQEENLFDQALNFCDDSQDFWGEGNNEKAIECLDQAYSIIFKVDTHNNSKLDQQKEDIRFMVAKRILEIYTSRFKTTNGNHKEIPLITNNHIDKEIKSFQCQEKEYFLESYKRSGKYRKMILEKLKEAGLPEELSWLPLIESGFKVKALSRARALGLWQFIPSTGYKFGLNRDTWVDERLDPEKATDAAIAYLKELHQIFGDWMTVLAAYNCGERIVLKAIRKQKANYLDNFWDLYEYLPRETARYVPRFLATLHIVKEQEKYGFNLLDKTDAVLMFDTVTIDRTVHLKIIAKGLEISVQSITELNPELRYQSTPNRSYKLKIPNGLKEKFETTISELTTWSIPKGYVTNHIVKNRDTLSGIALKYGISAKAIAKANKLSEDDFIMKGQNLIIPLNSSIDSNNLALLIDGIYKVKRGDTLWLISKMFNTDVKHIVKLNNLQTNVLHVNQTLKIAD